MARVPRSRAAPIRVEAPTPREDFADDILRLEDFWDEPAPAEGHHGSDLDRLQGAWMTVAGRRPAEILVSSQHLTVHFSDGDIYMGSFALDGAGPPAAMDVHVKEGPARHRGLLALCIYELDGDTLRWCTASPGATSRPTTFDELNPQLLCLTLRREHRANGQ